MFRVLCWATLALALALLTVAAASATPAAQARPVLATSEEEGLLTAAREWLLARFRPAATPPTGHRATPPRKSGCGNDPDGRQISCG